jgi:hypothetical protein
MVVLFVTVTLVAVAVPNCTVAPEAKFVPVIVTGVPPDVGPLLGEIPLTVGAAVATYVNPLVRLPLCLPTVTVTVTAPALPAGVVAKICVALWTVALAALLPNSTVAPGAKFVPRIVTAVPPPTGPVLGDTLLTVGVRVFAGAVQETKSSARTGDHRNAA